MKQPVEFFNGLLTLGGTFGGLVGCFFRRGTTGALLGYGIACTLMLLHASMMIQMML